MAKDVQDISAQTFMLSGMLVIADKVIADEAEDVVDITSICSGWCYKNRSMGMVPCD